MTEKAESGQDQSLESDTALPIRNFHGKAFSFEVYESLWCFLLEARAVVCVSLRVWVCFWRRCSRDHHCWHCGFRRAGGCAL